MKYLHDHRKSEPYEKINIMLHDHRLPISIPKNRTEWEEDGWRVFTSKVDFASGEYQQTGTKTAKIVAAVATITGA